jgi:hypothetical protein
VGHLKLNLAFFNKSQAFQFHNFFSSSSFSGLVFSSEGISSFLGLRELHEKGTGGTVIKNLGFFDWWGGEGDRDIKGRYYRAKVGKRDDM